MQRRLFIIIGVVLALVAVLGFLYVFTQQNGQPAGSPEQAATQEPTEIPMVEVIVAAQPIPRGGEFTAEALTRTQFPASSVPQESAIVNEAETIGKIANTEIVQGQIIVYDLLRDKNELSSSEAAFSIPPGNVMVAFPINKQTSVAYALKPGDVVDVLMTFSVVDLDTDFQTILPNKFSFLLQDISESSGGDQQTTSVSLSPAIDKGRLNIENEDFPGFEFPREAQRPRRVAQLTVQRGQVIKVGSWIEEPVDQTPVEEGAPTPTPILPDVASIAVLPQDALVLLWARQSGAYMELALRAAGDAEADHTTEAVTLQYMLTRFNIAVPPKLEFGIDKSEDAVVPVEAAPAPSPS